MSTKHLAAIAEALDPTMLSLIDSMVTGYMARRYGITLEQMQARIDTEQHIHESYARKMCRTVVLLLGPGGFQMRKHENTKPLAKPQAADHAPADPSFDINDLLSGKPTN